MTKNYTNPLEKYPAYQKLILARQPQLTEDANITRLALTTRQPLEWEGLIKPETFDKYLVTINTASTGDTVLLTGSTNYAYLIDSVSCYHSGTGTASFRLEIDYGSSFGSTCIISKTDSNPKDAQGQTIILKSTERLVLNCTTAVSSSTIDVAVFYRKIGFGDVYG